MIGIKIFNPFRTLMRGRYAPLCERIAALALLLADLLNFADGLWELFGGDPTLEELRELAALDTGLDFQTDPDRHKAEVMGRMGYEPFEIEIILGRSPESFGLDIPGRTLSELEPLFDD